MQSNKTKNNNSRSRRKQKRSESHRNVCYSSGNQIISLNLNGVATNFYELRPSNFEREAQISSVWSLYRFTSLTIEYFSPQVTLASGTPGSLPFVTALTPYWWTPSDFEEISEIRKARWTLAWNTASTGVRYPNTTMIEQRYDRNNLCFDNEEPWWTTNTSSAAENVQAKFWYGLSTSTTGSNPIYAMLYYTIEYTQQTGINTSLLSRPFEKPGPIGVSLNLGIGNSSEVQHPCLWADVADYEKALKMGEKPKSGACPRCGVLISTKSC